MSSSATTKPGAITRSKGAAATGMMIFRVLVLIGAVMWIASWFMPWWQAFIVYLKTPALVIRPWGVDSFLPPEYAAEITGYDMPGIFAPFMWTYLVVAMGLLLYGMLVGSRERIGIGKFTLGPAGIVGLVGLSYILCVVVAVIVMQMRMSSFYNAQLFGSIYIAIDEGHRSYVDTSLQNGYYLACVTGPYLVLVSIIHRFLASKRKVQAAK